MIIIKIHTDNSAFGSRHGLNRGAEVARILRELAQQVNRWEVKTTILDANGNTCGSVTVTGRDRRLERQ